MRSRRFIALALVCLLLGCGSKAREQRKMERIADQLIEANVKHDVRELKRLYERDYIQTNADGSVMDREAALRSYEQPSEIRFDHWEVSDRHTVVVNHRTAVVSQAVALHGMKGDAPITKHVRVTYVLVYEGDDNAEWQVLSSQTTWQTSDQ